VAWSLIASACRASDDRERSAWPNNEGHPQGFKRPGQSGTGCAPSNVGETGN